MMYWIYNRLGVHVMADDAELQTELDTYADEAIKGGRGSITPEIRDAIRAEHAEARELYQAVTSGRF